jgi:cell division protease FtsH
MGRDFMGGGAPPVSQSLRQKVDAEVKRIVDEQYKRGMFLLKSNMFVLDGLANKLLEQEKVGGEELMELINEAAVEGKLETTMAAAAYCGERVEAPAAKSKCLHPDKPLMFACTDCPRRGKTGCTKSDEFLSAAALVSRRRSVRNAADRLGVEVPEAMKAPACTGDEVLARVQAMVAEASAEHVPVHAVRSIAASVIVALAATASPYAVHADGVETVQAPAVPQMQMQQEQGQPGQVSGRVTYSRLLEFIESDSVKRMDMYDMGRTAVAQVKVGDRLQQLVCDLPGMTTGLVTKLQDKGVAIDVHAPEKPNEMFKILGDIAFPLLIIVGLLFLRSRSGEGGGMPGMPGMQNKAKIMMTPETGVKFENVAGIEEAKEELTEIVDFLKSPERFVKVGAKIPKGVLLTGPPGTGKTLMAKALAGESGVPFIQASASEFIEMFVGVGASRVRDIFKQAKEKSPCIVFIDEIDAIGRQRGAGMGGGNDEREQTLNQILTEMDGFEGNTGVIVVAATNRSDILDNALLRPGRFDRRVEVGLPDVKGRTEILNVHIKGKKLAEDVDLSDVAKRTAGFSGADLENLMNESAILTARRNKKAITVDEIQDATDRVIAGLEGRALSDNASKKLIAYHEAGHALVGTLLPHHDPVNKVTLVPRGQAKGLTWFTPGEDQSLIAASQLKARIAGALGGRAAEQVVFGTAQITTGAGGDLQQVERMARSMVTQLGMSAVGPLAISDGDFTGPKYSEELGTKIDDAIRALSDEGYSTALKLLMENRACLDRITDELVEVETLTGDRLRELVAEYVQIPEKASFV